MEITSGRAHIEPGGSGPPQLKFNNLFNDHFLKLIFFFKSIMSRKNWQGGGGLLLKHGTI